MGWKHRQKFLKAQTCLEASDYAGADSILTQMIHEGDAPVEAYLHRAYVRLRLGQLDEALLDAKHCTQARPEQGVMLMVEGLIFLEKRDFLSAHQALRHACRLERDNGRAFYYLGRACQGLGRKQEAAECFEVALQFERDFTIAQFMAETLR